MHILKILDEGLLYTEVSLLKLLLSKAMKRMTICRRRTFYMYMYISQALSSI